MKPKIVVNLTLFLAGIIIPFSLCADDEPENDSQKGCDIPYQTKALHTYPLMVFGDNLLKVNPNNINVTVKNENVIAVNTGFGPKIEFDLSYNSIETETDGPVGRYWTHSYNSRVKLKDVHGGEVTLVKPSGRELIYMPGENGSYTPPVIRNSIGEYPAASYDVLHYYSNDGYRLTMRDGSGVWYFSETDPARLTLITDRNDYGLTLIYDGQNRLVSMLPADGNDIVIENDATSGRITKIFWTPDENRCAEFVYDEAGYLITAISERDTWSAYDYDTAGQLELTKISTAKGSTSLEYIVGKAGRITKITGPNSDCLFYGFNCSDGRTREKYAPNGGSTQVLTEYFFNKNEGYKTVAINQDGKTTAYYYDDQTTNFVTKITDGRGYSTLYYYDSQSHDLTKKEQEVKEGDFYTTTYAYDGSHNLISVVEPGSRVTEYQYDSKRNLSKITYPGSTPQDPRTVAITYYTTGNLKGKPHTITNLEGYTTSYAYNSTTGRLTRITLPTGAAEITYEYCADGEISKVTRGSLITEYHYDVTHKTVTAIYNYEVGGSITGNKTSGYFYDNDSSLLTKMIDPNDNAMIYQYDALGKMTKLIKDIDNDDVEDPEDVVTQYLYDGLGRMTKMTDAEDVSTAYFYDTAGRLLTSTYALSATEETSVSYDYDEVGNVTSKTEGGTTIKYQYDGLNRLNKVYKD